MFQLTILTGDWVMHPA